MTRPRSTGALLLSGATAVALYVIAYFLVPPEAAAWMLTGASLGAALLMLAAARSMVSNRRLVWTILGIGAALSAAGNALFYIHKYLLNVPDSVIGNANVLYFAGYATMALGVGAGIRRRDPANFKTRLIDGAIMLVGTAALWWAVLIQPILSDTSLSIHERASAALYPMGDILLAASAIGLFLIPGRRRVSNALLVAAVTGLMVADAFYSYVAVHDGYTVGSALDLGWLVGYGLLALAGIVAHSEPDTVPAPPVDNGMTGRRIASFVLAALFGPVVLTIASFTSMAVSPGLVIASSLILFLLVLVRAIGLLHDQQNRLAEIADKTAALSLSEEKHRTVVNQLTEVLFQMDLRARWTFLNSAWEEVSGFTVTETLGRSCLEFVCPEDKETLLQFFSQLMGGTEEALSHQVRGVHKDGSVRWIEIFVRMQHDDRDEATGATGTLTDITDRKETEKALAEAEEKYRNLVEQIPVVTYVDAIGPDGSNEFISSRLEKLLGFSPKEWLSDPNSWKRQLHPQDVDRVLTEQARCAEEEIPFICEYRVLHRNGHVVWVRDEAHIIRADHGESRFWQGVVIDITERKVLEEQLSHQAFHDPLTNLANRALFTDRVSHALARRVRHPEIPVAVLFIDLDDFKTVNDSLGHAIGDELLKAVGERLEGCLRVSDTAARLGGDEFAVLVEEITGPHEAEQVAQRIIQSLDRPFRISQQEVLMGASVGIALTSDSYETETELLRNADLAMYIAKRDKGSYALFEPDMHKAAVGRLKLKADLKTALEQGQLKLHYQPVVDMRTREIVGAEALLRWEHPVRGMVPPLEFIPLAEESDLINVIGRWVLEEASSQASEFESLCPRLEGISMTVNLSGRQLLDPQLVDTVAAALSKSGIRPERLVLEITETALMTDVDRGIDTLRALKELGVKLAVDDFGTGYSSLGYLKRFPLDILKIDRSFVEGVEHGVEEAALASAVIKLGQTLGLTTIAEGVEVREQVEGLLALGCTFAQGFFYSRAVPPEELASAVPQLIAPVP